MRIVETCSAEIIFRPQADGPALFILKIDDLKSEIDIPVSDLLQILAKLQIEAFIPALLSKFTGG